MKSTGCRLTLAFLFASLSLSSALGGPKWIPIGEFQAGGDGKLAAYNGAVSACRLICTEGSIIVNTVIVIEGNKKSPISLGIRIPAGQIHEFTLPGGPRNVTGFRISDNARGKYRLEVLNGGSGQNGGEEPAASGSTKKKKKGKSTMDQIMEALPSGETPGASAPAPAPTYQPVPTYQPPATYQPPPVETPPPTVKAPAAPQAPSAGGDRLPWE